MIGLALFVALVAVLAAVALFLQTRSLRQIAMERDAQLEKARQETASFRGELAVLRTEAKERRDEAATLRTELGSVKKRAFDQAEAAKKAGGAPALRSEIDKLTTRLAESRAEAAHHADRVKTLELAAEKQAKELERVRSAAERKAAEPVAAALPAPIVAAPQPAPAVDLARIETERERADRAEAKLGEARRRVTELEKDLKAVRGRLETEKRVYMVQKGEIELANDRYAELRRRYDGLRKDHEELVEAVRQAAQEERRSGEAEVKVAADPKSSEGSVA